MFWLEIAQKILRYSFFRLRRTKHELLVFSRENKV